MTDPTIRQPGFPLPWQQWSLLNRFHTGQGHCGACRKTWRLTDTDLCSCGETQTWLHIVESCPFTSVPASLCWWCCYCLADQLWIAYARRRRRRTNETLTTGKLLWSNSWIVQTLGQWIQDCRTSRREGVTTEGAAVDTVLRRRLCFLSEAPRTGIGTWLSFPLFSVMMDGAVPANHLYQRRPFRAIASSASLLLWYMDEADCALVFLLI